MAKANLIIILVFFTAFAGFYWLREHPSPATSSSSNKTLTTENQKLHEELTQLKQQLEEYESNSKLIEKENEALKVSLNTLVKEKEALKESALQKTTPPSGEIASEGENTTEDRSRFRRRSNSPYSSDDGNPERRGRGMWGRGGWGDPQRRKEFLTMRLVKDLPSLTEEQKEYMAFLDEDFKEFRIQMIQRESTLSREEQGQEFAQKMEDQRVIIMNMLKPEQLEELDKMVEARMKEQDQRRQEEEKGETSKKETSNQ
jgi:hypothetical protein